MHISTNKITNKCWEIEKYFVGLPYIDEVNIRPGNTKTSKIIIDNINNTKHNPKLTDSPPRYIICQSHNYWSNFWHTLDNQIHRVRNIIKFHKK